MAQTYTILVGKHHGKRKIERPSHIWNDNLEMSVEETSCDCSHSYDWKRVE
jgi:hypothetical protein